jgi:hypothetical protein
MEGSMADDNDLKQIFLGSVIGAALGGYLGWKWLHTIGIIIGILGGGIIGGIFVIPIFKLIEFLQGAWFLLLLIGFYIVMPISYGLKGLAACMAMSAIGFIFGLIFSSKWWSVLIALISGIYVEYLIIWKHSLNKVNIINEPWTGISDMCMLIGFFTPMAWTLIGEACRGKISSS